MHTWDGAPVHATVFGFMALLHEIGSNADEHEPRVSTAEDMGHIAVKVLDMVADMKLRVTRQRAAKALASKLKFVSLTDRSPEPNHCINRRVVGLCP